MDFQFRNFKLDTETELEILRARSIYIHFKLVSVHQEMYSHTTYDFLVERKRRGEGGGERRG